MPRNQFRPDPIASNELAAQRLDLDTKKLSMEQIRVLTERTKALLAISVTRYKMEKDFRENLSSAVAVKRLGELDPTSPDYEKQRAAVLYEHSDAYGSPVLRQVVETQDARYRQHAASQENFENQKAIEQQKADAAKALVAQRADASKPFDTATAANQLSTALKNLDEIAHQFGRVDQKTGQVTNPVPAELQNAKTFLTKQLAATVGAPATTSDTAVVGTPVSGVPAPTASPTGPTAAQISTTSATDFLRHALGQTTTPAADSANAQLSEADQQ